MYVLRIEHPVADFSVWKATFDSDPGGRQRSGVRSYRVMRGTDDANLAMIDLEFDTARQAEAMLGTLRGLWTRVDGSLISDPQARIVQTVETGDYTPQR